MLHLTPTVALTIKTFNDKHNPIYNVVPTHSNYSPIGVQLQVTKNDIVIWASKKIEALNNFSKTLE